MNITSEMVKELRQATAAGILDCRKALESADGDFNKAVDYLREKGLAAAAKRMSREAKDGLVEVYSHGEGRIGVMVEINCETDFVARTEEFKTMVHDIAMHIAAFAPKYIRREDIPAAVLEHERELYTAQTREEGKPENIIEKIVEGRIEKFMKESSLMEQPFLRDDSITVGDVLSAAISKTGENMILRRFARFERGESLEG